MNMLEILRYLFYILIFPGFLFCFFGGLLLVGIDRKLLARMQRRIGPPVTQPFYDFLKLIGKETIIPNKAVKIAFLAAPAAGLISLVTIALFIPISNFISFSSVADLIVILYLLTIPSVALIIGGASSASPFSAVGISREMVAIISYELPLVIVLLAVGKFVGGQGLTFSMAQISSFEGQNGPVITHLSMIPAAIAMLLIIPCKVGSLPFDIAEAETELCEGPLAEYSGKPLALFKLNYALQILVVTWLFIALFLNGKGLFLRSLTVGAVAVNVLIQFALSIVVVIISITLLKAVTARLKVEQTFKFYWTYPTVLSLISFVMVWLGY